MSCGIWLFIGGCFVGAWLGALVIGCCVAASRADHAKKAG